ncbi:hypothetical protein scyTo_0005054 [Scyliorhinus torazame]|uniref:Uncharacterized protein n=1 Tax=Scyliorhinus torazame TaxID=75743 RepID=A0A401P1E6_SCYTO|nr:hypothetical protein [Scyliorhinus torazame]
MIPDRGIGQNFSYLQCSETEVRAQGPLCIAHCLENTFCYHWLFGVKSKITASVCYISRMEMLPEDVALPQLAPPIRSTNHIKILQIQFRKEKGKMRNLCGVLCITISENETLKFTFDQSVESKPDTFMF